MSLPSLLFFFHSIPLYSTPFHSVPYSTPLHPTPFYSPLHSTTLYSTPLHSIPLHSTPLHSTPCFIPFHSTTPHHTTLYSIPIYSTPLHFDTALFFSCILLLRMQPPTESKPHSLLRLFLPSLSLSVLFFAFFRPPLSYSPFFLSSSPLPPPPLLLILPLARTTFFVNFYLLSFTFLLSLLSLCFRLRLFFNSLTRISRLSVWIVIRELVIFTAKKDTVSVPPSERWNFFYFRTRRD